MVPPLFTPPAAQAQSQGIAMPLPAPAEALYQARDWDGLADWFETAPSATQMARYEMWIMALNRGQR